MFYTEHSSSIIQCIGDHYINFSIESSVATATVFEDCTNMIGMHMLNWQKIVFCNRTRRRRRVHLHKGGCGNKHQRRKNSDRSSLALIAVEPEPELDLSKQ